MRRFAFIFVCIALLQSLNAQEAANASYEVTKNMPVFYEQIKQQLTYPEAWGKSPVKKFAKWRTEARKTLMECMENIPPTAKAYNMVVVGSEKRKGYEARKILFNLSEWSRVPA